MNQRYLYLIYEFNRIRQKALDETGVFSQFKNRYRQFLELMIELKAQNPKSFPRFCYQRMIDTLVIAKSINALTVTKPTLEYWWSQWQRKEHSKLDQTQFIFEPKKSEEKCN